MKHRIIITSLVMITFAACSRANTPVPISSSPTNTPIPEVSPTSSPTAPFTSLPTLAPTLTPTPTWRVEPIVMDWLVTPTDLVVVNDEIYVSANLDNRIAVLDLEGNLLRYYKIDISSGFDNVSVSSDSGGRVYAASRYGIWELLPDGNISRLLKYDKYLHQMIVGSDDNFYIVEGDPVKISRLHRDGTSDFIYQSTSNRISDIEFNKLGDLYFYDATNRTIYKYLFSTGEVTPIIQVGVLFGGGGPNYLGFDKYGRLFISSADFGFAEVQENGTLRLVKDAWWSTGDIFYYKDRFYVLDIYTSNLFSFDEADGLIQDQRMIKRGQVPWYITNNKNIIVGQRSAGSRSEFFNYYWEGDLRIESNNELNELQPEQFAFDQKGNLYYLKNNILSKATLDNLGAADFQIRLPFKSDWNTRIHYNPHDDSIYLFDQSSNSIWRINGEKQEKFFTFFIPVNIARLAFGPLGQIYCIIAYPNELKIIDITNRQEDVLVVTESGRMGVISTDIAGDLFYGIFPSNMQVYYFDFKSKLPVRINTAFDFHEYEIKFVDIQGFTTTDSGDLFLSAPGLFLHYYYK
jgi:hypothetical protein